MEYQQEDVQEEDDADNLDKHCQYVEHLSGVSHVEENAEDINRQQGKYHGLYGLDDNFLEIVADIFQVGGIQVSQSESESEGHDECGHNVERFGYGYGEERGSSLCLTDFRQRYVSGDEAGEEGLSHAE